MKKGWRLMAGFFVVALLFGGCKASPAVKVPQAKSETAMDSSIPLLTGDRSGELLNNIDRGFRMETYYTLGSGEAYPGEKKDGTAVLDELAARFQEEDPREIQVYIYLNEYYNKDLDEQAFAQMKQYFENIRSRRWSMLLRFAYEPNQPSEVAPTQEQMLRHISQLKDWMAQNKTLMDDTVTAYQIGMIGAWGEWGSSNQKYDRKKIALAFCDMVPEGSYIQGRYMSVTKLTKKSGRADHVGYHNDFMVGRPHPWNTAGDKNYSLDYRTFSKNAATRMNDGEMPWVSATQEPDEYVDGRKFIQQAYEHHLATLSIEHNYKETSKEAKKPGDYNIARWKTETITAAQLREMGCPYYDSWFQDGSGKEIQRTVFEYLRDFLGYHLILSNLKITSAGEKTSVEFMVTNMGLGAPLTLDKMELAAVNKTTKQETRYPLDGFDGKKLTPYGQIVLKAEVSGSPEEYQYGVSIIRSNSQGDYAIRTANQIPFQNGLNMIQE